MSRQPIDPESSIFSRPRYPPKAQDKSEFPSSRSLRFPRSPSSLYPISVSPPPANIHLAFDVDILPLPLQDDSCTDLSLIRSFCHGSESPSYIAGPDHSVGEDTCIRARFAFNQGTHRVLPLEASAESLKARMHFLLSRSWCFLARDCAHRDLLTRRYSGSAITSDYHHQALFWRRYNSVASMATSQKRRWDGAIDMEAGNSCPHKRSELKPPKKAPSVWQIFFTDWLEKNKSQDGRKFNVAQVAKDAGQAYNKLSEEARDELKRRALVLKDKHDYECTAWKRSLTPDDISRENEFRAAQRRSGKSRRKNINDPNAPKRPLSAYFLFLQCIRADPALVKEVFGEETVTTRQSVLAAAKWRSMDDMEKKVYIKQAESARLEYEADCKVYENQTRNQGHSVTSVIIYPNSGDGGDTSTLSTPGAKSN